MLSYINTAGAININIDGDIAVVKKEDARYSTVMEALKVAHASQNDEDIEELRKVLSPGHILTGMDEFTITDGQLYITGIDIPVPGRLHKYIEECVHNDENVGHLINFFKHLAINPDPAVRDQLFGFLVHNGHPITSRGYFVAYKAVADTGNVQGMESFSDFIVNKRRSVLLETSEDPKNIYVYKRKLEVGHEYTASPKDNLGSLDDFEKIGALEHIHSNMDKYMDKANSTVYTDFHTRESEIIIGKPAQQNRDECDSDPNRTCSEGLHVGSMDYVSGFGHGEDCTVLECLVSPSNVVAVPKDYNNTKMRCCEYYPIGVSRGEKTERFVESDYSEFVDTDLDERLKNLKVEKALTVSLKKVIVVKEGATHMDTGSEEKGPTKEGEEASE